LLDNLTGDALVAGRTTGLVRSAWARLSSSRIAFSLTLLELADLDPRS